MPELPEVETTRRGIAPYVESQVIESIIVRQPKLRYPVSDELTALCNARVRKITRRAKYLVFEFDHGALIGHLGMSGSLRVVGNTTPLLKHDHLLFQLKGGKQLRYNDPRRFGAWLWCDDIAAFPLFQKLGPEPLSEAFDGDYLFTQSRKKQSAVKGFLMNNAVVVGVGNIYANESLFLCGIHPAKVAGKLTRKQCHALSGMIKTVLARAIEQGGTTLRDFVQPDGTPGYFAQQLWVYGRAGEQCKVCGREIQSAVIAQRNSFFCPHCQKK
ncbi:bifunctional DNA-formamidopyrimidine glycosylase/DNA-(apurinic or apyrimidinic site) lyase [Pasteurellaceae bacterium HPA106]|uniref:bifunctional DNA-formamidopyrimidine glycosylase/DNA-(apurinic or apyrimidinic site) lyase n=1 Tax=Spirabiliibacterium pneumoniae TaxID=221400 RepID=UPI001AACD8A0|nr:bifunctional DNA-formamidopyrimidine glycosylase/DNA-(apurinic or apyrimidinic site) lyase [Spirabiliibacterium pneumoniae]MBE2896835.1 bifunctional DNA-formamidopyrimidine glycosylase/DNA-(apurinic or apyrimidinic site) lyase [Spirabiliibacterium pneumoniae]